MDILWNLIYYNIIYSTSSTINYLNQIMQHDRENQSSFTNVQGYCVGDLSNRYLSQGKGMYDLIVRGSFSERYLKYMQ